jgi:hypothetical protein
MRRPALLGLVTTLAGAGLLGARTARPDEPAPAVPLWKAFKEKKVSVRGRSLGSYSEASLAITNRTKEDITVDVNASYLRPSSDVQPLGMGLLKRGSPVTEVEVQAGRTVTLDVLSVCMNVNRHAPSESSGFTLAEEECPGAMGKALKHWKEHPKLDQGLVQSDVWGFPRPEKHKRPDAVPVPVDLPALTHKVAVASGIVFAIVGPGQLFAAAPGSELKPLASDAEDMVALEDGLHVLFRTAPAAVTSATVERRPCVAHWEGERRWKEEVTVAKLGRLAWAAEGAALIAEERELALVRGTPGAATSTRKVIGAASDPVVLSKTGALVLRASEENVTRLVKVSPADEPRVFEVPLPLVAAAWGAEGDLFALSRQGALFVLAPDGTPRRLQYLLDDQSRSTRGEAQVKALSLQGFVSGLLVGESTGFALIRGGLQGGFDRSGSLSIALPPTGSTLFVDSGRELWARSGVELHHLEGTSWCPVRFIAIPPQPKRAEEETDEDGVAPIATAEATVSR